MTSRRVLTKDLLWAAVEDGLSAALGLPLSTAKTVVRRLGRRWAPWLWPDYFLRWDSNFALDFYTAERPAVVGFPLQDRQVELPAVVQLDPLPLPLSQIRVKAAATTFTLDPEVSGLTDRSFRRYRLFLRLRRRNYKNGKLLRLSGVEPAPGAFRLRVQPVRYEAVCRTHLCLDARERPNAATLREVIHPSGRLCSLESSRMANALGVNFLVITADGRAVLPRRSRRVVVRPRQLSPSFSGDLESTDVSSAGRTLDLDHLLREGFEELNVEREHLLEDSIRFLGLARSLIRGGKPELFFVATSKLTERELLRLHTDAPDSWEFTPGGAGWVFWQFGTEVLGTELGANAVYRLRRRFEDLFAEHGAEMSVPLQLALVLWLRTKLGPEWLTPPSRRPG